MLRSQPLAAGLDPRFTVLDEAAARRLRDGGVRDGARASGPRACGAPAVDLAAAYGRELEPMITRAYATLRSRGATRPQAAACRPRLPAPDPAAARRRGGRAAAGDPRDAAATARA